MKATFVKLKRDWLDVFSKHPLVPSAAKNLPTTFVVLFVLGTSMTFLSFVYAMSTTDGWLFCSFAISSSFSLSKTFVSPIVFLFVIVLLLPPTFLGDQVIGVMAIDTTPIFLSLVLLPSNGTSFSTTKIFTFKSCCPRVGQAWVLISLACSHLLFNH